MFTIVAGTGYTGQRVLEQLPTDSAIGLGRTSIKTARPFTQVDFDTMESLPVSLPDRYAVLYTCPPDDDHDTRLQRFLSLLTPVPARFVYISTTGVYGDLRGATATEETPVDPGSRIARRRITAEKIVASGAVNSGCDLVILRVPGIYGPGRLGEDRLQKDVAFLKEEDARPGNRIHVDDLASCCIAALAESTPTGIYNVGDGVHHSATWFADEVARQAALPAPRKISLAQAEVEFPPMRLAFLASSRIVDTAKMREVLGITPRGPEQGISDSLT